MRGWPIFGFLQGASVNWLFVSLLFFVATIPLLPLVFVPKGRQFERILSEAQDKGEITSELIAGLRDKTVRRAYQIEWILYAAIIYLMVMKPF